MFQNIFAAVPPNYIGLVVTIIVTLILILLLRKPKNWNALRSIPGPPKYPIFGSSLQLWVESYKIINVIEGWVKQYGSRIYFSIGSSSRVFLIHRNDVEKVLSSNVHINKSDEYIYLHQWIGSGLITSNGDKWFGHRKMLTPAFHFRILENFLQVLNEQSAILVQNLEKFSIDQATFDVFPLIARHALDVISETAMGIGLNAQRQLETGDTDYVKAVYRMVLPWLQPQLLWILSPEGREEAHCVKIIHDLAEKVIRERKLQLSQNGLNGNWKVEEQDADDDVYTKGKKRLAFLDLLLEAQAQEVGKGKSSPSISDLDIREEVDTIMFAGHDTTTANIAWTLYLLGTYPETQGKVQAELDSIFMGDRDRNITSDDLTKMKYLECCIKETLRLYPSVPIIGRNLNSDLELDESVTLPAGTSVFVVPYFLHRDSEVFPDPENFLPERFLPENANGRHPFAYTPFSAGPRNCIGQKFAMMEIKVTLAQLFRNFNLLAMEKREDVLLCVDIILRPKNGIPMKIIPRT